MQCNFVSYCGLSEETNQSSTFFLKAQKHVLSFASWRIFVPYLIST
ncbi:hypothetical protein NC652_014539 [Populus alba x Populus x berolinensis]|nr:hypothetical protein NC652_014539 [Populus alba x Populus x berolinensis]